MQLIPSSPLNKSFNIIIVLPCGNRRVTKFRVLPPQANPVPSHSLLWTALPCSSFHWNGRPACIVVLLPPSFPGPPPQWAPLPTQSQQQLHPPDISHIDQLHVRNNFCLNYGHSLWGTATIPNYRCYQSALMVPQRCSPHTHSGLMIPKNGFASKNRLVAQSQAGHGTKTTFPCGLWLHVGFLVGLLFFKTWLGSCGGLF